MDFYNKHYIRIDDESNIIHGFSDALEEPRNSDILINELGGRQFELFGEENPSLRDFGSNFLYKWNESLITKSDWT